MFCVYLTSYSGNKLPPFYIGSSSVELVQGGYRGSVKSKAWKDLWRSELKTNKQRFKTQIVSVHSTRKEAFDKEEKLQRLLRTKQNCLYVNIAIANKRFNGVIKHTVESRKKIAEANKGKKMPPRGDEYRQKQRIAKLGKVATLETKAKMSKSHTGAKCPPRSAEYKEHQRKIQTGMKHKPWSEDRRLRYEQTIRERHNVSLRRHSDDK